MNDDISISEGELNIIINNMNSELMEISKCFESISSLNDSLYQSLEGDIGNVVRNKFVDIEDNFSILKNNYESYIIDFQNVIKKFNNESSAISLKDVNLAKGGETVNVKI